MRSIKNEKIQYFNNSSQNSAVSHNQVKPIDLQNLYVVTAVSLNVRTEPSDKSSIIGRVVKGDTILVNKVEGEWGYIPYGLRMGYVPLAYTRRLEEDAEPLAATKLYNTPQGTYSQQGVLVSNNKTQNTDNTGNKENGNNDRKTRFYGHFDLSGTIGGSKYIDNIVGGIIK